LRRTQSRYCFESTIVEVARATSAAPGYFPHVEIKDVRYIDGAVFFNNPANIAWNEAWQMAKLEREHVSPGEAIGLHVSIGTGKSVWQIFGKKGAPAISKYLHMLFTQSKIVTDTETTHHRMFVWNSANGTPYHRFNVQKGLEKFALDEWRERRREGEGLPSKKMSALEYLTHVTEAYLNGTQFVLENMKPEVNVRDSISQCARRLVEYRRARKQASGERPQEEDTQGRAEGPHGEQNGMPNGYLERDVDVIQPVLP